MRPSFVVYVLLLSLIHTKTQGIRLGKGSLTTVHQQQKQQQQQQQQGEENTLLKRSKTDIIADEEGVVCKDEECTTGNIKNRKLVTTSVSTIPTISKNVMKNGGNEAHHHPIVNEKSRNNVKVINEAGDKKVKMSKAKDDLQQEEHFPDLDDIVEMDYSPARRKPPIHN